MTVAARELLTGNLVRKICLDESNLDSMVMRWHECEVLKEEDHEEEEKQTKYRCDPPLATPSDKNSVTQALGRDRRVFSAK